MPSDEMVEKAFAFEVGQPVEKFTGEALWSGVVVSRYHTTKGGERYVVEVKPQGFQMIAVPSQLRTALAAAEAGEPVAVGVKTDPPVVAIGSRCEPVYRYQTPDHRSFSQTTPPMTPDQSAIERSFASPLSEASREERLIALLKRADHFLDILGGGQLADHAYTEFEEVRADIATAIRARVDNPPAGK